MYALFWEVIKYNIIHIQMYMLFSLSDLIQPCEYILTFILYNKWLTVCEIRYN